jgi:hypothetical protein
MPIDFSSDLAPSFRDLSQAGLLVFGHPLVRSVRRLRRLRRGLSTLPETPAPVKTARLFRRSPLPGSLS